MATYANPKYHAPRHGKLWKYLGFILLAIALPVVGYGIMHLLVYLFPLSTGSIWAYTLFTLVIIALGLAIPLWMLKAGLLAAHERDSREKEFHMRDIPKDKKQLEREQL